MNTEELGLQVIRLSANEEWHNGSDGWGLFLLKNGAGYMRGGAQVYSLKPSEGLLLPSGVACSLKAGPGDNLEGFYFHFLPEHLTGVLTLSERLLFEQAGGRAECISFLPTGCRLARQMEALTKRSGLLNTLEHRLELLRLIAPLTDTLRRGLQPARPGGNGAGDRVASVLEKVKESDLLHLPVTEIAKRCGCSRRHLNRLVRERFRCSVLTLKIRLRLEKAALMLNDSGVKVITVAYDCGFNHLGSFTAKFRKRFGTTPAKWRDKMLTPDRKPVQNKRSSAQAQPTAKRRKEKGIRNYATA